MIELGSAKSNEISVIKDPFGKDNVTKIMIVYEGEWGEPYWYARIEFKNGNTSGDQRTPRCKDFEEVYAQLKLILDSVRNK